MIAFTDEDLKRLTDDAYGPTAERMKLKALLARLEAAEKVAERLSLSWEGEAYELINAWRKAAGK